MKENGDVSEGEEEWQVIGSKHKGMVTRKVSFFACLEIKVYKYYYQNINFDSILVVYSNIKVNYLLVKFVSVVENFGLIF